jgi:hypothetical protein
MNIKINKINTYTKIFDVWTRCFATHEVAAQPRDVAHEFNHLLVLEFRVHLNVVKIVTVKTRQHGLHVRQMVEEVFSTSDRDGWSEDTSTRSAREADG